MKSEQMWLAYRADIDNEARSYFGVIARDRTAAGGHMTMDAEAGRHSAAAAKSGGQPCSSEGVRAFDDAVLMDSAVAELKTAAEAMFGTTPDIVSEASWRRMDRPGICLRLVGPEELRPAIGQTAAAAPRPTDGYRLRREPHAVIVEAETGSGLLYGAFALIRLARCGALQTPGDETVFPSNPLRLLNHWDNLDGSIERGYSGRSFFFEDNRIVIGGRLETYARLLASVGINGTVINNVNVFGRARELITDAYLRDLETMAEIYARWGVRLYLCVNFASPMLVGGLATADPLDEDVVRWWRRTIDHIYEKIPNFGGFLVKADSEGQPGPFDYGRSHAEGANMLADLLKPHGGILIWRCFVYVHQDWRDQKTDRAKAAYENFMPVDGQFHENVILQIKNGPVDFQIREPVSPLFGGLRATNEMLEVQIAQEYTGQQIDVCYLVPMWKEVLDFKTGVPASAADGAPIAAVPAASSDTPAPADVALNASSAASDTLTVADIVSGRAYGTSCCGIAGVANTGSDANWTGNDLAAANFYGYGRLAFQTNLSAEAIAGEWSMQTFGREPFITETVLSILLDSRRTFENYTCPLGTGWMMDEYTHYEPVIDMQEYGPRGTYHRADHLGIGTDRGRSGSGYVDQYPEPLASLYNSLETCPEELLLFFHHVPYSYRMKDGRTLLQYIYDTHFEGAEEVHRMAEAWEGLKTLIEPKIFERVRERFDRQIYMAEYWRDSVNTYFYRKSLTDDEHGRKIFR